MPFGSLWGLTPYSNGDGLLSDPEALDAQRAGNLGIGAGLLSAAGPSPYPISVGQALSGALLQGRAMQSNTINDAMKRKLLGAEIVSRLQPPAAENKLVPIMTPQGPRLVPESVARTMPGGAIPYDANVEAQRDSRQNLSAYEKEQVRLREAELAQQKAAAAAKPDELSKIMTPSERAQFRMADGSPLPPNILTLGDALQNKAVPMTQAESNQKEAKSRAAASVDRLEYLGFGPKQGQPPLPESTEGVLTNNAQNPIYRGFQQAGESFGKNIVGTNQSTLRDQYERERTALATSLAAAETENGVARPDAVNRYLAQIPPAGMNTAEARRLMDQLRARLGGESGSSAGSSAMPSYVFNPSTGKLEPK